MTAPAAEGVVTLGDVALFTRTVGSGPDVVVLHGGPGAHHDYLLPQFDALAAGRTLRYYDQRGGGRSPVERDVPVDAAAHVADLHALIDRWNLVPVTLLGYSWGGLLALLYTSQHPANVERLALVSPAPTTAVGRHEFEQRLAERSRTPSIRAARDRLRQSDLRASDPDAYRQRAFELSVAGYFANPARVKNLTPFRVTGRTQDAVWRSLGDYDLRPLLQQVSIPALVLHGVHDPIPQWTARETAELLDAEFVEFQDSGHVPYVEELERFVAVLDAFLPKAI